MQKAPNTSTAPSSGELTRRRSAPLATPTDLAPKATQDMLDKQATELFAITDPLAERCLKLGGPTLRCTTRSSSGPGRTTLSP